MSSGTEPCEGTDPPVTVVYLVPPSVTPFLPLGQSLCPYPVPFSSLSLLRLVFVLSFCYFCFVAPVLSLIVSGSLGVTQ